MGVCAKLLETFSLIEEMASKVVYMQVNNYARNKWNFPNTQFSIGSNGTMKVLTTSFQDAQVWNRRLYFAPSTINVLHLNSANVALCQGECFIKRTCLGLPMKSCINVKKMLRSVVLHVALPTCKWGISVESINKFVFFSWTPYWTGCGVFGGCKPVGC